MLHRERNPGFFRSAALITLILAAGAGCKKPAQAAMGGTAPVSQVIVARPARQPVAETLSLVGTLAANEIVELKSETDGVVQEILFREGQPVKKGDLLVRLDETKLAASLAEAEANFKLSEVNNERTKQLSRQELISQQESDQVRALYSVNQATLELKKRQLQDARIYASFDGVVGDRQISPGQVISKNTTLTWLIDADPVKAEFNVPERFLSQLQLKQTIELIVAAYPGRRFKGEVFFISPFVDAASRTALVKAKIPNPTNELKPGMFANLDLTLQVRPEALVIPETALTRILEGDRAMIFIVNSSNRVEMKRVELGVRLAGGVEVRSGLQGTERVIVEGTQKVGPGAAVSIKAAEPVK